MPPRSALTSWSCCLCAAAIWTASAAATTQVTVSNTAPKLSTTGEIVDAHDGTYVRAPDGYFYYHGAEYGRCKEPAKNGCDQTPGPVGPPYPAPGHCGFQADHNVSIWRSRTLASRSWEFVGRAARCATDIPNCGILYRPHVVYNPSTKQWVLFVNYVEKAGGGYGGNAVFTAPHPAGPFTLRTPQMALTRLCPGPLTPRGGACGAAQGGCGDFDVIVDPADGAAYIIYGCNFYMGIERLTPDFLDSAGAGTNATVVGGVFGATTFPEYFVEAPAFFHRNGTFYALFGHCCCFCYQGSGVMAYTAPHPLGPWRPQCSDVVPAAKTGCLAPNGDLACTAAGDGDGDHGMPWDIVRAPVMGRVGSGGGSGSGSGSGSGRFGRFGGAPTPGQGCLYKSRAEVSTVRAQQNYVITVPRPAPQLSQYLWTGDRWQQAPDGVKGHEGQTWIRLEFDDHGRIQPIKWQDNCTFEVYAQ
eukprot:g6250.t1